MIDLFKKTCEILSKIPTTNEPGWVERVEKEACVVYPAYNSGGKRFSEQEARFIFAMLLRNKGIPFSVEVPTENRFKFGKKAEDIRKDVSGRSASYDLVAYPPFSDSPVYIEFKAREAREHSVIKDIVKLYLCGVGTNIFFHILKNADDKTFISLSKKYQCAIQKALECAGAGHKIRILVGVFGTAKFENKQYHATLFEYKEGKFINL
jgi:hypothetical protein